LATVNNDPRSWTTADSQQQLEVLPVTVERVAPVCNGLGAATWREVRSQPNDETCVHIVEVCYASVDMTKHGGIGLKTLWMVVDGVGLSLVAAATIMEGVHLWTSLLGNCWDEDQLPLTLWFAGRALQLLGLFILIGDFTLVYGYYRI
jgi:hypothetical protein